MDNILHSLGCNKKEIQVYLTLLKIGLSNISQISQETKIPRQSLYYILNSLVNHGLAEQTDIRGIKKFAVNIFELKSLIDHKKSELEANKHKIDNEIIRLMADKSMNSELPKVQYYQGQEGLRRLLTNILNTYSKGKYKTFKGYAINEYYPGMEKFIENFVEQRHKLGITSELFIPRESDIDKLGGQNSFGRTFKKIDTEYHKAAFYIVGNKIYIFSYKDGVGIMIENTNLANFFRDIFGDHWNKTN